MKYYSEETVKGILEQIDSHYVKALEGLPSVDIPDSSWHTGTPTEDGNYVVIIDGNLLFWEVDDLSTWDFSPVERWQKIEPFKEATEMRNDIEAVEAQTKIKQVFDKVVEYKCKQFRRDYPKSSIGKKVIKRETIHICRVLFPEIYESLLIETITHYIGTLEATE